MVFPDPEFIAVMSVQPIQRANPDKAVGVLSDGMDGLVGQIPANGTKPV